MDPALIGLISAATAVLGGVVTKGFDSWLGGRSRVIEELRQERLDAYKTVWAPMKVLSAWPRTNATYGDLKELHLYLRSWYFDIGGLYMSENARRRYGEMQELIAAHLDSKSGASGGPIGAGAYTDLMDGCSAFRTATTEDLESRRQSSLFWTIGRLRLHRKQEREAQVRLARVSPTGN